MLHVWGNQLFRQGIRISSKNHVLLMHLQGLGLRPPCYYLVILPTELRWFLVWVNELFSIDNQKILDQMYNYSNQQRCDIHQHLLFHKKVGEPHGWSLFNAIGITCELNENRKLIFCNRCNESTVFVLVCTCNCLANFGALVATRSPYLHELSARW